MEMMARHTEAVSRGAPDKLIIGDMPFLSYRKGLGEAVQAAGDLMKAGAHAVKLEGAEGNEEIISHLIHSGIPVMGHLGMTPQSVHVFGGHKVQGRDDRQKKQMLENSKRLEKAGCFSLVLECVPATLAREISEHLTIPVIGIGAGSGTDGQVLVLYDVLGLTTDFKARFVRRYMNGDSGTEDGVNRFVHDIRTGDYPSDKESFS
jgi:3-methyl-2-oxobutanoate hydroxymethyltransferase